MKRLILHIGSPKAGSTSLQGFLRDNRAALARVGVDAPEFGAKDAAKQAELRLVLGEPAGREQRLAGLFARLEALPGDTAILSAESLAAIPEEAAAPEALAWAARDAGFEVDVLAFVRAPHLFMNSSYAQHTHNFREDAPFARFVDRMIDDRRFDPGRCFGPWSRVFGERFHPMPFTRARLADGLERVFFRAAGLGDRLLAAEGLVPLVHANASGGPLTVELFRRLAPRARSLAPAAQRQLRGRMSRAAARRGFDRDRFVGLDDALAARIRAHLAAANEAFAEAHWGEPWSAIFAADEAQRFTPNEFKPERASAADAAAVAELAETFAAEIPSAGWPNRLIGLFAKRFG
jgi:hypothetical protein